MNPPAISSRSSEGAAPSELSQQVRAYQAAVELIAANPARALAALRAFRARWPGSALGQEADLRIVQTLLALGQAEDARQAARTFVARTPRAREPRTCGWWPAWLRGSDHFGGVEAPRNMRRTMTHQRRRTALWLSVTSACLLLSCAPIDLGDRGDAGDGTDGSGGSGGIGATGGTTAGGRGSGGASAGRCGDGTLGVGESCDDGNAMAGDGCSATCAIEAGYTCPTPGQPCVPGTTARCGDGQRGVGESCDDGNAMAGDGCSATCAIEAGYTCPTPGQPCVPGTTARCGDGQRGVGESCDDGNAMAGDGCSATCAIEAGFTCPTPGQPCVPDSGCASRPESTCKTDCAPIYGSPTGDLVNNRVYVGCQELQHRLHGCHDLRLPGGPAGELHARSRADACRAGGHRWPIVGRCRAVRSDRRPSYS